MRMICSALAVLALSVPALAQGNCGPRADVVGGLLKGYGETAVASGAAGSNSRMEVFLNPDSGTWTIIATLPNGRSCLLASGNDWTMHAVEAPGIDG